MRISDFFSRVITRLRPTPKEIHFVRFRDGMGNFEIFYPKGWRYDPDIAVMDGKYTISFMSADGLCQYTISVDTILPERFRFAKYAKDELESPSSGIYTKMKKSVFDAMPAYKREYCYYSGSRKFFGGGVMFFTGDMVFSLSWSAPQDHEEELGAVFSHMLKTLSVRRGYVIRKLGGFE